MQSAALSRFPDNPAPVRQAWPPPDIEPPRTAEPDWLAVFVVAGWLAAVLGILVVLWGGVL